MEILDGKTSLRGVLEFLNFVQLVLISRGEIRGYLSTHSMGKMEGKISGLFPAARSFSFI